MHANYTQQYKGTNFWFLQPLRWILLREKVKIPHHKCFILWDSCNDTVIEIEVTWGLPGPVEREGGWYQGAACLCWWNSLGIDYSAGYRNLWLWEHLLELFIHRDVFKNNCRQKWQPRLFSGSWRTHWLLCIHHDFSFEFFVWSVFVFFRLLTFSMYHF